MANEGQHIDLDTIPESDAELEERLREATEKSANGEALTHEEVWTRIERRRTALRTLEEQMKKSA